MALIWDMLAGIGVALVLIGVGMIYLPAAVILFGLLLIAMSLGGAWRWGS